MWITWCKSIAGYGYVEEYPAERAYRDSRINRIFEGTNEINRLIITGWLMKRAVSGQLPLLGAIKQLMDEVMGGPTASTEGEGPLAAEHKLLATQRSSRCLPPAPPRRSTSRRWPTSRKSWARWPIASWRSTPWRAACCARGKLVAHVRKPRAKQAVALTRYYAAKAMQTVELAARKVIAGAAEGDMLRTQMAILRRLAKHEPADTMALGRQIAKHVVAAGKYAL